MSRMPLVSVLSLLAAVLTASCTKVQTRPEPEPTPEERLHRALAAVEAHDFLAAHAELTWLHLRHPAEPAGQHALLILTTLALDPRDPYRRPTEAAQLAAGNLRSAATPAWARLASEVLYLLALDLGAAPVADAAPVVSDDAAPLPAPRPLPALPGMPLASRLAKVIEEREQLARRVARLEQDVARRDQELERLQAELERIRRTLRP